MSSSTDLYHYKTPSAHLCTSTYVENEQASCRSVWTSPCITFAIARFISTRHYTPNITLILSPNHSYRYGHAPPVLSRYLINNHNSLVDAIYEGVLYWGEVALHICAANGEVSPSSPWFQASPRTTHTRASSLRNCHTSSYFCTCTLIFLHTHPHLFARTPSHHHTHPHIFAHKLTSSHTHTHTHVFALLLAGPSV